MWAGSFRGRGNVISEILYLAGDYGSTYVVMHVPSNNDVRNMSCGMWRDPLVGGGSFLSKGGNINSISAVFPVCLQEGGERAGAEVEEESERGVK